MKIYQISGKVLRIKFVLLEKVEGRKFIPLMSEMIVKFLSSLKPGINENPGFPNPLIVPEHASEPNVYLGSDISEASSICYSMMQIASHPEHHDDVEMEAADLKLKQSPKSDKEKFRL